MSTTLRQLFVISFMALLTTHIVMAQPKKGEFINASIGLGVSAPYEEVDIYGSGFYALGEYVFAMTKWFGVKPYAGLIFTSPDKNSTQEDLSQYKVTSNAFLLGGKIRLAAPIPWVAPYIETGLGVSLGSFETYTPNTNIKKKGLLMHLPISTGLALGRDHNIDFAFTYYYHPSVDQFSGALAVGLSFPLNQ
ncbi:hypothetical protein [Sediminicola luteus]|uniref:Outer membrane protein beta-barrel domain-containing protein n=1 Tax=Sediminicola luteus TaxID=319238 RepID=A0ABV2U1K9_9FLAO